MRIKKRIAALLMAGAMICSTLPVNALAMENSNYNVPYEVDTLPLAEEAMPDEEQQVYEALQAQASTEGVKYLDENGSEQTANSVTEVESSTTTWNNGWYVVNGTVTIGSRVTVSGEVHLILADNASLTVIGGINVTEGNSFSVYAQSVGENMGTLTATSSQFGKAGIGGEIHGSGGNITINGGNVTATGGQEAAGIGGGKGGSGGNITINGGNVTATSEVLAAGIGGGQDSSGGNITINGGNVTATSVAFAAGIGGGQDSSGGNITINGGNVTATSVAFAAGIGGGQGGSGGNITINGGTVTATGGQDGAGIGSGNHGSYDTITINGGSVTATGGDNGAGIGDGIAGSGGSFTTGTDGHALIFANGGISDTSKQSGWRGIIFDGDNGKVYGDQTLQKDLEIKSGKTLTVPENTTLTVKDGVTLTNNGTITGNGTLDSEGNLVGSGTVAQTITNNLQKDSAVSVTVSPSPATYGSKVSITATISRATNAITLAAENQNQVEFFVGTDSNKKSLGTADVKDDTATLLDVEISQGKGFAVGENTITAAYSGSMGLKPQTGSTRLTVKGDLKDAIVTVNGEYFYTNSPITPEVSVTWNGTQLTENTDYTVNCTDNTNAGKATVTVNGKGNYTGTKTENFTIAPASYQITLAGKADSPTKITLDEAVVNPSDTVATITYGYSTTDATPTNWQTRREFTGLKAGTTYYFFAKATATANYTETISKSVAITTPEKTVREIKISKQPNKLSYTSGQKLDLSGLSVQVNYNDNTDEMILWESGKLTAEPAQETVLTVANHNGKTITISYGGQTAQTDVLTVGKAEQAALSITGAPGKIYKGSSFTLQTSGGSGEGTVTWSVVSGSATVNANGTVTVTDTGEFQIKAVKAEDAEYNQTEALIPLTAVKKSSSGGGSSSGSGGGGSSTKPAVKPAQKPAESTGKIENVKSDSEIKAEAAKAEANAAAEKAAKADEKVALVTKGTSVSGKDFTEPAVMKVPVDTKNVKDVNHLTLARLNAGKLEIIGGAYNADAKAVIGYADAAGDYFVVEKDGLTSINLQIDNNGVVLDNANKVLDAAPVISQNRTMVPLRFIAEAFGANVSWAAATKTVTIVIDGKALTMTIGQDLEGFGAAPILSNGRTMVPISYISKAMDAHVIWVPSTKTVAIAK